MAEPLTITSPIVSAQWLLEHLEHPKLRVLDATIKKVVSDSDSETTDKKIKNSRYFDLKNSFSCKDAELPTMLPDPKIFAKAARELGIHSDQTLIIYDRLGICSSARVWWMFHIMGHKNVAILDGGFPEWEKEGFPIEYISEHPILYPQGNFESHYSKKSTVDAQIVLQSINDAGTLIIDARSRGRFDGTAPEPRDDLKGGHIPNSINLPYTEVLQDYKMLPVVELKQIFKSFNIADKNIIFSCGSGITACIILLAATLAGYENLKIYDGSWTEWGQLDGVPIISI